MTQETTLLVIFVALTAFALLVQAIVMLVAFLKIRTIVSAVQTDVQELRTAAMPVINRTRETLEKIAPKIESVATDAADLAHRLKVQGVEFEAVAAEILDRVHRQTSRVDNMFTGVVDGVEHAGNVVADTITRPVRQIVAMLSGAKAFFSVLATGRRPDQQADLVADRDMFV